MKTKLKYLLPILLLTACTGNRNADELPDPLFPQPQTVDVNPEGGYTVNPVNGDTIQPIINSYGDTVKTGVPIPATPKIIHPDSVSSPQVVKAATELVEVNAHPNRHKIPEDLTVIPVTKDSLTTILLKEISKNDTLHYLINSIGDTLKTGVPIPTKGKTVPTTQPQPTNALPPRFKDAAINNMQYLDVDQGMASSYVISMLEDNKGNLWFGTSGGGVSMYDGASFTHFTEKEGLSNNRVFSILEDNKGNLWMSTDNGISCIKQNKLDENTDNVNRPLFTVFEKNDGLKGMDFYANSVCLDSKNRIWWGSGKSLTMLDMNKFKPATNPPAIYLKQLDINEQFIDYRNITDSLGNEIEFNGVQQFENYPLNLELPYDKNHLTFNFAAIDWHAPHKIQYSYIMEGLNTTWSKPTMEPIADYRNLPYGTYTFKVRAIGESGEWSEPHECTFTIHPPWWHTWWARIGYGLLALLFVFGTVRWRTAALRARQKQLEQTVEERTQELKHEKEIVEEKHKEITDSINYAERIQRSFLATKEILDANLKDYFVFFKPKEAVSGDFYWASELNDGNFAWSVADSTGHGVPGAIMSLLNISSLEKSIETETSPEKILYKTREIIINRLKKDGSQDGGKDGMDCNLLVIDKERTTLTLASANNPVVIVRNGELIEFKGDKIPVGKHDRDAESFTLQTLHLQKGDVIYALTDGFPDQFGGEKGKKYMIKNLKNKFLEIANSPMEEQHQILSQEFDKWKAGNEQIDDVCIIGVRI